MVGELAEIARKSRRAETRAEPMALAGGQHPARQAINIELTEEQLGAILDQWRALNPGEPIDITFSVSQRPVGELRTEDARFHA